MLSDSEMVIEMNLLKSKIKNYSKQLEPYLKLEKNFQEEINNRFKDNDFAENLSVVVSIKAKSMLWATLKRWQNELRIYQRIYKGKMMDRLP